MSIRKDCADHLRQAFTSEIGGQLRAGHAHELVAAFFGYGNGAALRADHAYSIENLFDADILVPDIGMLRTRMGEIDGLPANLVADDLVRSLSDFLLEEGHFGGAVWHTDNLAEYVSETYLPDVHWHAIMDDLSGPMAETNASFDGPDFDEATIGIGDEGVMVTVSGTMDGDTDTDRAYSGHTIHFTTTVNFDRVAGKVAFSTPEVETGGEVDRSYYDED